MASERTWGVIVTKATAEPGEKSFGAQGISNRTVKEIIKALKQDVAGVPELSGTRTIFLYTPPEK